MLVCGGRDFADLEKVRRTLNPYLTHGGLTVAHGAARGADTLAGRWAKVNGTPVVEYPADWTTHGRSAGPIRNRQMLDSFRPDVVVAFLGGRGTADMVSIAQAAGVPTVEVR